MKPRSLALGSLALWLLAPATVIVTSSIPGTAVASDTPVPCGSRANAIIATSGGVMVNSGARVDSYSSESGPYGGSNIGQNGNVIAAGTITNNGGTIRGQQSPNTQSDLLTLTIPSNAVPLPIGSSSPGSLNINDTSDSVTLAPGVYVAQNLNVNYPGSLNISPAGSVTIYVSGSLNLGGNENPGGLSENLAFVVAQSGWVNVNSNGQLLGTIYAPSATINLNSTVFGSVVGSSVTLNSGAAVHYDQAAACPSLPQHAQNKLTFDPNTCSEKDNSDVWWAWRAAVAMAEDAYFSLKYLPESEHANSPRYHYHAASNPHDDNAWASFTNNFWIIQDALIKRDIAFVCHGKVSATNVALCQENAWGQVDPKGLALHTITLCPKFWEAHDESPTDYVSYASTIVHEMSHFNDVVATRDGSSNFLLDPVSYERFSELGESQYLYGGPDPLSGGKYVPMSPLPLVSTNIGAVMVVPASDKDNSGVGEVELACPPDGLNGTLGILIGGSWQGMDYNYLGQDHPNPIFSRAQIYSSRMVSGTHKWKFWAINPTSTPSTIRVWVHCLQNVKIDIYPTVLESQGTVDTSHRILKLTDSCPSGQIAVGGGFEAMDNQKNNTGAMNFHILADHRESQIFEWSAGHSVHLRHQTLCLKPSSPPDSSVATAAGSLLYSEWGAWNDVSSGVMTDAQYYELAPDAWNETSIPVVPRPRLHGVGFRRASNYDLSPALNASIQAPYYQSFILVEPPAGADISYILSGYHTLHWPSP